MVLVTRSKQQTRTVLAFTAGTVFFLLVCSFQKKSFIVSKFKMFSSSKVVLCFADASTLFVERHLLIENSEVFKAMLESELQEKLENKIEISDFSSDVFSSLIRCLTNSNNLKSEFKKNSDQLLQITHKYQVNYLLEKIENRHVHSRTVGFPQCGGKTNSRR